MKIKNNSEFLLFLSIAIVQLTMISHLADSMSTTWPCDWANPKSYFCARANLFLKPLLSLHLTSHTANFIRWKLS